MSYLIVYIIDQIKIDKNLIIYHNINMIKNINFLSFQ